MEKQIVSEPWNFEMNGDNWLQGQCKMVLFIRFIYQGKRQSPINFPTEDKILESNRKIEVKYEYKKIKQKRLQDNGAYMRVKDKIT